MCGTTDNSLCSRIGVGVIVSFAHGHSKSLHLVDTTKGYEHAFRVIYEFNTMLLFLRHLYFEIITNKTQGGLI